MADNQKITTCLWFDNQAEQAAAFYSSVFKNSKVKDVVRYGDAGPGPKGEVMLVTFELDGREFMGLNGGPIFKFTEAISLVVHCEDQAEIDYFWDKLTVDGEFVPKIIDFGLVLAVHDERNRFCEFENRPAIQTHELAAIEFERDQHHFAFRARAGIAVTHHVFDL